MNWDDPQQVKAYKAGWMRGFRLSETTRICASPLAKQVMLNEMERARTKNFRVRQLMKSAKKKSKSVGNDAWKELA